MPVPRSAILDYVTYEAQRASIQAEAFAAKAPRRVHCGGVLTFLFENDTTVRYQVLEMVRTERIVREADIQHELDTYNELLGGPGALGCVLLVEIEDPDERDVLLRKWVELPTHVYVELEDGTRIRATVDERQISDGRVSSVQYLKFDTQGAVPVAVGSDLPDLDVRQVLSPPQRSALEEDLRSGA